MVLSLNERPDFVNHVDNLLTNVDAILGVAFFELVFEARVSHEEVNEVFDGGVELRVMQVENEGGRSDFEEFFFGVLRAPSREISQKHRFLRDFGVILEVVDHLLEVEVGQETKRTSERLNVR